MQINYQALYEANCAIIRGLEINNKKLNETNADLQLKVASQQLQLDQLRRMIFSSKQERFVPDSNPEQLNLPLDIEAPLIQKEPTKQKITYDRVIGKAVKAPQSHPGRNKLPDHLERRDIIQEPAMDTTGMKKIGEEITEELELEPGKLYVNRYVRPKYVNVQTEQIVIAPMVERPLPKCIAGAGLLTQLLIDKYVDHLPIYRICERFKRDQVNINYNTMIDWVSQTIQLIKPLYEALKKKVLSSDYIHADETGLKVMDKDKKGSTHQGWLWAYVDSVQKMALFDYQPTRGRAAPYELLKNYEGYLQVDGYSAYEIFNANKKITLLYCMAHSRRKFFEAQANDTDRSTKALEFFQQLYAIERAIKEQNLYLNQITIERQKTKPILDEFHQWMKTELLEVLPKSPIGQAISYTLERWNGLCIYTTNPKLNIDNNPVENSIRPIAIGRKNYLFAGSHEAAQRTAMLYSLMATCKLNDINPYTWLKETLTAIPSHPINKIEDLLPLKK